jgi:hypothetical protein
VTVNRELLRRYLRVSISGTTLTQTIGVGTIYLNANTPTS